MVSPSGRLGNTIIRASAGTGKTYQLSNRYLRLILTGQPPERILAATFTRKAAGEILERILFRLATAARDAGSTARLAQQLDLPELELATCRRLLRTVTRNLHRLRVGTLDSFFLQAAQTLSLELGLPPSWTIVEELEADEIRSEAISKLLQAQDEGVVGQLLHWLAKGDTHRGVYRLMSDTVATLYELFLEAPPEAWRRLKHKRRLNDTELAVHFAALSDWLADCIGSKTLQKAVAKICDAGRDGEWSTALKGTLPRNLIQGDLRFSGQELPAGLVERLEPLIEHGCAEVQNRFVDQLAASRSLLEHFHEQLAALKLGRRALRFNDLPRLLARLEEAVQLDQISFRLDATIDNLLLDEFQDTSLDQWRALRIFAQHATEPLPNRSFFCVGDVKQAIYGWRGGNAELLDAIGQELDRIEDRQLDESFRSSAVVIDVVNQVNLGMATHDNLGDAATAVRQWTERFPPHSTARHELPGYVTLETHRPGRSTDEERESAIELAVERVAELRQAAPHRSIAVLVRTNEIVGRVIYALQQRGILASEEAGNPLTDSAAVQLVLSRLQLTDFPDDSVARFHLARSPWAAALNLTSFRDDAAALSLSRASRQLILDQGYGAAVDRWAQQLQAECSPRESRRLAQLVALAYRYQTLVETPRHIGYDQQQRQPISTAGFRDLIERHRVSDPTEDPVRVMNVHQSKGLQFDVVVLPDLDRKLIGQTPNCVFDRPHPTQPIQSVVRWVNADLRELFPDWVERVHQAHLTAAVREELCIFYVAMTRAVHALHMIVAPSEYAGSADPEEKIRRKRSADDLPATCAGLIRAALTDHASLPPTALVFTAGDRQWWAQQGDGPPARRSRETIGASTPVRLAAASPSTTPRGELSLSPSQLEGDGRISLGRRFDMRSQTAMWRGSLVHAFLEQVEWLDRPVPTDAQLQELGRALGASPAQIDEAIGAFRRRIVQPVVAAQLSRAAYADWPERLRLLDPRALPRGAVTELAVRREQRVTALQPGGLLDGSIDRLVLLTVAGRPVAGEIIDFKTDLLRSAPDRRRLVDHYTPQLQAYLHGLSRMLCLPAQRLSAQLLFLESDERVEVRAKTQPLLF